MILWNETIKKKIDPLINSLFRFSTPLFIVNEMRIEQGNFNGCYWN